MKMSILEGSALELWKRLLTGASSVLGTIEERIFADLRMRGGLGRYGLLEVTFCCSGY